MTLPPASESTAFEQALSELAAIKERKILTDIAAYLQHVIAKRGVVAAVMPLCEGKTDALDQLV